MRIRSFTNGATYLVAVTCSSNVEVQARPRSAAGKIVTRTTTTFGVS
jgi:hypothetical protein